MGQPDARAILAHMAFPLANLTIEQVQRWVISFLILAVSLFPTGALIAAVHMLVDQDRRADAVILVIVMAILGMIAMTAIRIVHRRSPAHWLLLLGIVPAVVTGVVLL